MRVWIAENLRCFFAERLTQKPFGLVVAAAAAVEVAASVVATAEPAAGLAWPAGFAA